MPRKVRCEKTFVAEDKSIKTPSKTKRTIEKLGELFAQVHLTPSQQSDVETYFLISSTLRQFDADAWNIKEKFRGSPYFSYDFVREKLGDKWANKAVQLIPIHPDGKFRFFQTGEKRKRGYGAPRLFSPEWLALETRVLGLIPALFPNAPIEAQENLSSLLKLHHTTESPYEKTSSLTLILNGLLYGNCLPPLVIRECRFGVKRTLGISLTKTQYNILFDGCRYYDLKTAHPTILYQKDVLRGTTTPLMKRLIKEKDFRKTLAMMTGLPEKEVKSIINSFPNGGTNNGVPWDKHFNKSCPVFSALLKELIQSRNRFIKDHQAKDGFYTNAKGITLHESTFQHQGQLFAFLIFGQMGVVNDAVISATLPDLKRTCYDGWIVSKEVDVRKIIEDGTGMEMNVSCEVLKDPFKKHSLVPSMLDKEMMPSPETPKPHPPNDVKTPPVIPKRRWETEEYKRERENVARRKAEVFAKCSPEKRAEVGL